MTGKLGRKRDVQWPVSRDQDAARRSAARFLQHHLQAAGRGHARQLGSGPGKDLLHGANRQNDRGRPNGGNRAAATIFHDAETFRIDAEENAARADRKFGCGHGLCQALPLRQGNRVALEGVRQNNRIGLEGVRQGNRVSLRGMPTYRDSLIQSELELLKTEGELFSGALASSGVVTDPDGSERLQPDTSRQTIRRLVDVSKTRARLFMPNGTLVADSFLLSGPGGILLIEPLPPPEPPEGPILQALGGAYDWLLGRFPASDLYPPYGESAVQVANDYQEVKQALEGETGTFVRSGGDGSLVLSVAVPVQRYRQVLGALFLTKAGKGVENTLRKTRLTIIAVSLVALGITVLASLYLASTIALPIHRLADAAGRRSAAPELHAGGSSGNHAPQPSGLDDLPPGGGGRRRRRRPHSCRHRGDDPASRRASDGDALAQSRGLRSRPVPRGGTEGCG